MQRIPWLRRVAGQLLPLWFAIFTLREIVSGIALDRIGDDAEIYYRGAAMWLAGGSPWDAVSMHAGREYHFYAGPTAAIVFAPFTLLPEIVFIVGFLALQVVAAVYVIRRLGLPWWWLLFPPIVSGIVAANPSVSVLALLLIPHPVANAIAPMVKVYAGVPLLGEQRWRAVAIAVVFGVVSLAIAPQAWVEFLTGSADRTTRLMLEAGGGYSGFRHPALLLLGSVSIAIIARYDLRIAGWLLPIAVWPGSQLHWSTLALPVMNPWLAVTLSMPHGGIPVFAVAGVACWLIWRRIAAGNTRQEPSCSSC